MMGVCLYKSHNTEGSLSDVPCEDTDTGFETNILNDTILTALKYNLENYIHIKYISGFR